MGAMYVFVICMSENDVFHDISGGTGGERCKRHRSSNQVTLRSSSATLVHTTDKRLSLSCVIAKRSACTACSSSFLFKRERRADSLFRVRLFSHSSLESCLGLLASDRGCLDNFVGFGFGFGFGSLLVCATLLFCREEICSSNRFTTSFMMGTEWIGPV